MTFYYNLNNKVMNNYTLCGDASSELDEMESKKKYLMTLCDHLQGITKKT